MLFWIWNMIPWINLYYNVWPSIRQVIFVTSLIAFCFFSFKHARILWGGCGYHLQLLCSHFLCAQRSVTELDTDLGILQVYISHLMHLLGWQYFLPISGLIF